MNAKRFRCKPLEVEAIKWSGHNVQHVLRFIGQELPDERIMQLSDSIKHDSDLHINTRYGILVVAVGDWIVRGVRGEFYTRKADIFELSHEEITD